MAGFGMLGLQCRLILHWVSTLFQKSFAARTIAEWNSLLNSITSLPVVGFGVILQKTAVCCVVPVGVHTPLPQYPAGDWQLLSRSSNVFTA